MPITFACPLCGKSLAFRDDAAGKLGQCTKCREKVRIPGVRPQAAELAAPEPAAEKPAESRVLPWRQRRRLVEMACPQCQTHIAFQRADAGRSGTCYNCGARVIVPAHSILPPAPPVPRSALEQGIGIGCGIAIVLGIVWLAMHLFCLRPF